MTHFIRILLLATLPLAAQPFVHEVPNNPADSAETILHQAANVVPSLRQLAFHQLEFTCFIHFGPNTFTGS